MVSGALGIKQKKGDYKGNPGTPKKKISGIEERNTKMPLKVFEDLIVEHVALFY